MKYNNQHAAWCIPISWLFIHDIPQMEIDSWVNTGIVEMLPLDKRDKVQLLFLKYIFDVRHEYKTQINYAKLPKWIEIIRDGYKKLGKLSIAR